MKSKIRVAHIISGLWRGGAEQNLVNLLKYMDSSRFELHVICLRQPGFYAPQLETLGIPVHLCRVKRRLSPHGLFRLQKLLRTLKITIAHSHMYRSNTTGTIAAILARVPVIINHIHSIRAWDNQGQIKMDRRLMRFRDGFIFVSKSVQLAYLKEVSVPTSRQSVIYNGIDRAHYSPGSPNPMKLSGDIRIGAVGRLMKVKGFDRLLEIIADINLSDRNIQVYILGDGPMQDELQKKAEKMNLQGYFHLLGFSEEVSSFLRSIHIFAMPSLWEGFPLALIEAMATGLPCIACGVGGILEAINHEKNGFLVPPADLTQFRNHLLALVENRQLRQTIGMAARESTMKFSVQNMASEVENLYTKLLDNKLVNRCQPTYNN